MSVVDNGIERFIHDVSSHKVGLSKKGVLLDLSGETSKMSIDFSDGIATYVGTPIVGDPVYNIEFAFEADDVVNTGRFSYDIEVEFDTGKLTFVKDILELIEIRGVIITRTRGDTYPMSVGIRDKDGVLLDLSGKTTLMTLELTSGSNYVITGTPITGDKDHNVKFAFLDEHTAITSDDHIYSFKDSGGEIYSRNAFKLIQDVTP